jgi:endoglucanase
MKLRRLGSAGTAAVVAAAVLAGPVSPTPAQAATNDFRGVNWADQRDNFVNDTLVLGGLSTSDSYSTTVAKANAVLTGFQNNLNANTLRIPVNFPTVSGAYWNSYRGVVDAAVSKGFKVIMSYWEAANSRDGFVDNTTQFWSMWQTIVGAYGGTAAVYFEPMNEPHGYSAADWKNLAAQWLSTFPSVPRGRIVVSGAGFNTNLVTIGSDTRFDGTLISRHTYRFFNNDFTTEEQFANGMVSSVGSYANRVIVTEWGSHMTDGRNYNVPSSSDAQVSFVRGTAAALRFLGIGSVYWPGVRINDTYSLQNLAGSGTGLTLTTTNQSGKNLLQYSWGMAVNVTNPPVYTPATYYRITNRNSGKVIDVISASTANNAEIKQWTWNSGANQKWSFVDAGGGYFRVVNLNSGRCLDVAGASTADGANVIQFTCGSGTNQQWQWAATGSFFQLRARHSGKCLDVVGSGTGDGADIQQFTCGSGTNQQWSRTVS